MLTPNKYNFHRYLFVASAGTLLLSGVDWLIPTNDLIRISVRFGVLPSSAITFLLGLRFWATRSLPPEDARKSAHDKAKALLDKLAHSPVGGALTDASRKVVRVAALIEDHNHPELHVYEPLLDELYHLVPACQLPQRYYGGTEGPLLDWHKYHLCIIAAEEDLDSAKKIKDALLHLNGGWKIYLGAMERDEIGEEQERFIKRIYFGGSFKCLVLLSYHMINHGRSKQELHFAMQRGQIDDEVCKNYLIPVAMDKYGLDYMNGDDYLRRYSEHLEIIQDRTNRFEAIIRKLSKLLRQSIFYVPPAPRGREKKSPGKRFAVALSYPGEYRPFVEDVAEELTQRLNDELVFYDRYYIPELARIDLDDYLQTIYSEQSELVVVFLCAEYEEKKWCGLEWRAVLELIVGKQRQTIMLIRFDKTDIPELDSNVGYIDAEYLDAKNVANLIIRRLFLNRQS